MSDVRELVADRATKAPHRCFLADARSERSVDFAALHTAALAWCQEFDAAGVPPGARVPSITTLMQEYGIARNTARHALAVLAEEGLIEITPGWGSFVKPGT